jgi:hypothetical protein
MPSDLTDCVLTDINSRVTTQVVRNKRCNYESPLSRSVEVVESLKQEQNATVVKLVRVNAWSVEMGGIL